MLLAGDGTGTLNLLPLVGALTFVVRGRTGEVGEGEAPDNLKIFRIRHRADQGNSQRPTWIAQSGVVSRSM